MRLPQTACGGLRKSTNSTSEFIRSDKSQRKKPRVASAVDIDDEVVEEDKDEDEGMEEGASSDHDDGDMTDVGTGSKRCVLV